MDLIPRYTHPFTLAQAEQFDISVIAEEIARLQNSLQHLKQTQAQLREFMAESNDQDLEDAFRENQNVIASQEERVLILNMVLLRKGVRLPDAPRSNNEQNHEQNAESANRSIISDASPAPTASGITEDTDEGVYL